MGGVQRRDLQFLRVAETIAGARSPLLHSKRHGGHRSSIRGIWQRLRTTSPRNVWIRAVGRETKTFLAGAGPARNQAGLLRRNRWPARLLLGAEVDPAASGSRAKPELGRGRASIHVSFHTSGRRYHRGNQEAGTGTYPDSCAWARPGRYAILGT